MKILPIDEELKEYLQKHNLELKFQKQIKFFEQNPFHPSLKTELLEPKELRFWSFRIYKKYRAIFIFYNRNTAEIIDVNNHYR